MKHFFLTFVLCMFLQMALQSEESYTIPRIQFPPIHPEPQPLVDDDEELLESTPSLVDEGLVDEALESLAQKYWRQEVEELIAKASVSVRMRHFDEAEDYYIEALNRQMTDDDRKALLMEMVKLYEGLGIQSKKIAILEKYIELYPGDDDIPERYLELGRFYRKIGAPETAISRFYNILNASIGASAKNWDKMRNLSREAQLEIAETYFSTQDYEQAKMFFERLKRIDISEENLYNVSFKLAYSLYQLKEYKVALIHLNTFIAEYPTSELAPEAQFLKASTLRNLGRTEDAIAEVQRLIHFEGIDPERNKSLWFYWQKKTANQIANEFYVQNDFLSALRIYQAMLPLSDTPKWQWPIIYQMGLCFEHLSMLPKARDAYQVLLDGEDWDLSEPDEYLDSIRDMAAWRKEHLDWLIDTELDLSRLLSPTTNAS